MQNLRSNFPLFFTFLKIGFRKIPYLATMSQKDTTTLFHVFSLSAHWWEQDAWCDLLRVASSANLKELAMYVW